MSLPDVQVLKPGRLHVTIMDFRKGDVFPMHNHNFDDSHITIVARGRVEIRGKSITTVIHGPGAYLDWPPPTYHEFEGLEDGTRIVNIRKIG